ncbi:FHA domain-containing protein [Plantactinospora sp. WMMB334]|uniref:FHA domain-containing protein n=1 Tax=Plantactinospora sp. WMMB334 TaxID=3404119 RepID=UPI003B93B240
MSDEHELLPILTVTSGSLRGASFRLGPGLRRIGREDGADVLLDDPKVSRRHATVELAAGRVVLTDTGSTNGTWINDERLRGHGELRDGDRIRLGNLELRFFDPGAAATDRLGTYRDLLGPPAPAPPLVPAGAGGPASAAGALAAPTQLIGTPAGRSRRMLLMIGGCVVLAGGMAWAYLALG